MTKTYFLVFWMKAITSQGKFLGLSKVDLMISTCQRLESASKHCEKVVGSKYIF